MAIEGNADVARALARPRSRLEKTGAVVRCGGADVMHLTLVFLGSVPSSLVEALGQSLDSVAAASKPFDFTVEGLGSFGNPRAPWVIWAGIGEPAGRLVRLQSAVAAELRALGLQVDARPYVPHLTLGRVKSPGVPGELAEALATLRNTCFGTVHADRVVLFESELLPQGTRHVPRHEAMLGAQ